MPAIVLGVGFVFHTDFDPSVFGKYRWPYFAFLCGWWIITVPLSYLFGKFLFGTQTIRLARGREGLVRPRVKLMLLFGLGVPLVFLSAWIIEARIKKTTATVHTDAFHPYLQNTPKPGRDRYQINRLGFRGEEMEEEKPHGAYRIFMLGGSTAFCGNLPYQRTHCGLLQEKLRAAFPEVTIEVQNAATDWHTSQHSVIKLLTNVQDYDPDLVIIFHGINDLMRGLMPDAFAKPPYRRDYRHYYGAIANFVDTRGAVFNIINMYLGFWFSDFRNDRIRVLGPEGEGVKGTKILFFPKTDPKRIRRWKNLPSFERNMRDFVAIAQSKGIKVVMASQPYLYRDDLEGEAREVIWFPQSHHHNGTRASIESMIRGMEQSNAISKRIAAEAGVTFVDLEPLLPKTLEYFYDDVHYTPEGNRVVADAFFKAIVNARLIPSE